MNERDLERQSEAVPPTTGGLPPIERGWTVYDSAGRPLGNVADQERDQMQIDGRPYGLDSFSVPLDLVGRVESVRPIEGSREVESGRVHLNLTAEEIGRRFGLPRLAAGPAAVREPAGAQAAGPQAARMGPGASGEPAPVAGSASPGATPPGSEQPGPARAGGWLVPAALAATSIGVFTWWRRRQARRRPFRRTRQSLEQMRRRVPPLLVEAGQLLRPRLEAARESMAPRVESMAQSARADLERAGRAAGQAPTWALALPGLAAVAGLVSLGVGRWRARRRLSWRDRLMSGARGLASTIGESVRRDGRRR